MNKRSSRKRRAGRVRAKIKALGVPRLCVFRTSHHIYAQVIAPDGGHVVTTVSTLQADIKGSLKNTGNVEAAVVVGKVIAEKAKASGISKVAFDRSGYKYHGRVKALANAAREAGLEF